MANNGQIKILAVQALSYPENLDEASKNIADHIHKSMNKEELYYLYKGYKIELDNENDSNSKITEEEDAITPLNFYRSNKTTTINICSIVGVNGSGKSSIIELIIRVINNFSAVIIGEEQNKPAAVHLHFIDHLYARIICLVDNIIISISIEGRKVTYSEYQRRNENKRKWYFLSSVILNDENLSAISILKSNKNHFKYLKNFFYTIICNYSLYAYNVNDYVYELSNEQKIKEIRKKENISNKTLSNEDLCWLKGLFHKNDSYQTPVVITPFRGNGFIDATRENSLAKERLISLFLYREKKKKKYSYPLRLINGSLEADALYLSLPNYKKYKKELILETLGLKKRIPLKRFEDIYNYIKEFWLEKYAISYSESNMTERDATSYLVYKTLKIFRNYTQYNIALKLLAKKKDFKIDAIQDYLSKLFEDLSHITNKLRQTITFLKFKHYYNSTGSHICKLDTFAEDVYKLLRNNKNDYKWRLIDFLPSPIFEIEIQLYDIIIDPNRKTVIPFFSLSAGERQIAYTISSLLYHLININSVWDNNLLSYADNANEKEVEVKYNYVNIILDEVELYFHPELQRKFISYILDGLKHIKFDHLKGIQILMITHSPFVLSDIPSSNILFLKRGCKIDTSSDIKTFAANIHEMLSHNFFMESTIGKYAEEQIKQIIELYNQYKNDSPNWRRVYEEKKEHFQFLVNQIGEEYLRKMLNNMLLEMDGHSQNKSYIEQLIKQKEKEITSLKSRLNDTD